MPNLIYPPFPQPLRLADRNSPDFAVPRFDPDAGPGSRLLLSKIPSKASIILEYQGLTAVEWKIIDDFYLNESFGSFRSFIISLAMLRQMQLTNADKAMIARMSPTENWIFKEKPKSETIVSDVYKLTVTLESSFN